MVEIAVELSVCLRFSDQLIHVEPACVGLQGDQYGFYEVSRLHQDANESHPKVESGGVYLPSWQPRKHLPQVWMDRRDSMFALIKLRRRLESAWSLETIMFMLHDT